MYAGYSDGKIGIWNLATGILEELGYDPQHTSPIFSIAVAPNTQYLATGHKDGALKIWYLSPFRLYGEMIRENNSVTAMLFTNDSRYIYTGNADGKLRKWNVENKNLENVYTRHRRLVNSAAFSPDGKYLATGASDNSIILWNVALGEIEKDIPAHADWVTSLSFSPNGNFLISSSIDTHIKVWAIPRGYQLRDIGPFESAVWSACYITEDRAVFGTASGNLSLWNVETAKEIRMEKGAHGAAIRYLDFSAKTGQIYSASNDGMIKIWDSENLNLIATLLLVQNGEWISYMPLGKYTSSQNALLRGDFFVKDGNQEYPFEQYRDFLQRVDFLPIGDVSGPEITLLNEKITPRENILTFEVKDPGIVVSAIESNVEYPIQDKIGSFQTPFDIWKRTSSSVTVEAEDTYGNISVTNFEIKFDGFRFFLKDDFPPLSKNALLNLVSIVDNQFTVEWVADTQGEEYVIPKDKVTLTPYAPEIAIQIIEPVLTMNQTEAGELNLTVIISDVLGVKSSLIGSLGNGIARKWQEIIFREAVKKYDMNQSIPLQLGTNLITVRATNVENITKESTLSVTRVERIPPEIIVSALPPRIFEQNYPLNIRVSDNYLVSFVSINGTEYPVLAKEKEFQIQIPVAIGENKVLIEAVDAFRNSSNLQVVFQGLRTLYVKNDGTKITDSSGNLVQILMKGDEANVISYTPPRAVVELESGRTGIVDTNALQWDVIDLLPPGFFDAQAKLQNGFIRVTGFVYDDKDISSLNIGGQAITMLRPAFITIPLYPLRKAYSFEVILKMQNDEVKPVIIKALDTILQSQTQVLIPRVYP